MGLSLTPSTDMRSQIRQGLLSRGLAPHIADAFIMNFQDESGLNPGINEIAPLVPGSRGGFGLYQLTGPRRVAYEQFAKQRGVNPADVDAQLDFMMMELQGPESRAAKSIFSAPDTGSAAAAIVTNFLRPAEEHRNRRVAKYTGGMSQPNSGTAPPMQGILSTSSPQTEAPMEEQKATGLLGSLFPNMTADRQDRLAVALSGLSMNPNQGIVEMASQRMADRRDDRKEAKTQAAEQQKVNKTLEMLGARVQAGDQEAAQMAQMLQAGMIGPMDVARFLMQKPEQVKPIEVNGQLVNPQTGQVVGDYRDAPKPEKMPDSFRALEARAQAAGLAPGSPEYQRFMVEGGRANGLDLRVGADGSIRFTQGNVDGPQDVTAPASPEAMISSIDGILNDPALDFSTGFLEWMQNVPGTGSARFGARAAQLNGQAFLRAFESLKGGGQITEIEGQKATEAIGRLSTAQSPKDYRDALTELKDLLSLGLERQRTGGKIESNAPGVTEVDLNGTIYRVQRVD